MMIKLGYSHFSIQKLVGGHFSARKTSDKIWKLVFTGPHFLKAALNFAKLVLDANN